ncbi:MAG: murein biosynthesis integral membrane protein MurJ [Bdellovibrionota bacterium]|jgi:putative peptidoglycan lipid II flippase
MDNSVEKATPSLLRGTGIVAALTLLSRALGFIEQLFVAKFFGAGGLTDAFFIAFRIPNLLRSFVAEGALTSAFVPVFTSELAKSHKDAQKLLRAVTTLLCLITLTLSLLGIIYAPEIVSLIAPGFGLNSPRGELCILLTRIMFPYIMFVSLVAMLNGALNSVNIYGAAPLAQVTMNIVLIFGVIIAGQFLPETGLIILAAAVIVGGFAQLLIQIPSLKKANFKPFPSKKFITPQTRQILLLMTPAIFGSAVYQIGVLLNSVLASLLKEGSVSWLFYADRLAQLPIGVFTVALASVLLPTLSKFAAKNDPQGFANSLNDSLRYTSFCMIPLSFLMFAFALPITKLVFERGSFTPQDSAMTALAVQATAFGLWGISCHSMAIRGFLALKDTVTPVMIGIFALLVNILVSLSIMGSPEPSVQGKAADLVIFIQSYLKVPISLGHAGLAFAGGFSASCALLLTLFLLKRRYQELYWKPFFVTSFKTVVASGAMYLCVVARGDLFSINLIVDLLIDSVIAVITFTIFAKILKIKELEETFQILLRVLLKLRKRTS